MFKQKRNVVITLFFAIKVIFIFINNIGKYHLIIMTEERLNQIIRESIEDVLEFGDSKPLYALKGGNVDKFTPYSKEERERNFSGIGRMGNPSYDKFKAWREDGLRRGIPSRELGWTAYQQAMNK
jgi:hypothetical protein